MGETSANVAHGDLQTLLAQNLLSLKLVDFNSAFATQQPDCLIYEKVGTQQFAPPECFMGSKSNLGRPCDVWSAGCVLFNMLLGRCPFWAERPIALQLSILDGEFTIPEGIISTAAQDLIHKLMHRDAR